MLRRCSGVGLVAVMCVAEVLGMLGNATFPALIPTFVSEWSLSNAQAGWVSGVYYGGYVAAVPVLVSITDRLDARLIYLACTALGGVAALGFALFAAGFWSAALFRFLGGVGLAGTYMVGLKLLSDHIQGPNLSRSIPWYTSSFGIGGSLSVLVAGEVAALLGWHWAFGVAALGSLAAVALVLFLVAPGARRAGEPGLSHALDFRPVFANKRALAYVLGYAAHVWELFGFRGWIVAFLAFSMSAAPNRWADGWSATQLATIILLLGMPASILGNELAARLGRRRVISAVMLSSAGLACLLGFSAAMPFWTLFGLLFVYGWLIMADSGALTAGAVAAADPLRRGATMAVHSLFGFGAGFIAPLAFGVVLDLAGGGRSVIGWGLAFAAMGLGAALGPLVLARLGR